GQVLADRQRRREDARLDRLGEVAGLVKKLPHREVPGLLGRLQADDGRLAGIAARAPAIAGADDVLGCGGCPGPVPPPLLLYPPAPGRRPPGGGGPGRAPAVART